MTPHQAKKIIADALRTMHLPGYKLTAKTISFSGFGYGSRIFVKIHGWQPGDGWRVLASLAHDNGFSIE